MWDHNNPFFSLKFSDPKGFKNRFSIAHIIDCIHYFLLISLKTSRRRRVLLLGSYSPHAVTVIVINSAHMLIVNNITDCIFYNKCLKKNVNLKTKYPNKQNIMLTSKI